MADELFADNGAVSVKYAHVESLTGTIWNGTSMVAYVTADIADYDIAMTRRGSTTGYYGTMPATLPTGVYRIKYHVRAGGSPAESDSMFAQEYLRWGDGVVEPADMVGAAFDLSVTDQATSFQYQTYYQGSALKIRFTADPPAAIDLSEFSVDIGIPGDYDTFSEDAGNLTAVDEATGIFDAEPTADQSAAWPLQDTEVNAWRDDIPAPVVMGKLNMRRTLRGAG